MGEFNADEVEPPSWLNKEFFKTVLSQHENDYTITVNDLKIAPATGKGGHYASIMFRVVAAYSSNSKGNTSRSMIVKTVPEAEGLKKNIIEKSNLFRTEISMYSEELPKFEQVLRKHGDHTNLCAKMIYHSLTPRQVIVFEDLVELGYDCIRGRSISIDELKACLSKLAKIHAVSYKLAMEGDESVKKYDNGLLTQTKEELPDFITGGLKHLISTITKMPGLEIYAEKLEAIEPTLITKCNDVFHAHKLNKKAIMVLNHGDFHLKNVMFKFDKDNKLEDAVLIDFQVSCFAPAVIDIIYSLFMLFNEDLRNNHREELIYFYFSKFLETLKNIEYDGELPTLADFYIDMITFKDFEILAISIVLPIIHNSLRGKEKVDMGDIMSSNDALDAIFKNPSYIRELRQLLPKYLHKGYFG